MVPLTAMLESRGFVLVVPNGPHKAQGAAFGAAGLDSDDSFGWWLYAEGGHDSEPLELHATFDFINTLGEFDGVVGFSQGGAMAAHVAKMIRAKWAVLLSPVYIPGHPAQCECPTLVAFDEQDDVMPATAVLLDELSAPAQRAMVSQASSSQLESPGSLGARRSDKQLRVKHHHGHRLPPQSDARFYAEVDSFLDSFASST
jgi:dienelactone hydrolase